MLNSEGPTRQRTLLERDKKEKRRKKKKKEKKVLINFAVALNSATTTSGLYQGFNSVLQSSGDGYAN
jgi:hypothetical protein